MNDENVLIESVNSIVDWMTKIGLTTGCTTDPHDPFCHHRGQDALCNV